MKEEERLLREACRGDRTAFEALVKRYQGRVFWTAFQVIGHHEDARDVAQQVFIQVWRSLHRYKPGRPLAAWLHRITVNSAIDTLRRRSARPEDVGRGLPEDSRGLPAAAGGTAGLEEAEIQRIFLHLSRRLTGRQRAVFVLKEMNGLCTHEIAKVMGLQASTVRNHLHQARRILRRGLAALYPEYMPRGGKRRPGGEGQA
ncbi:MAG: RNA polymerase sigma factor [Acidobacteriota bacterium]